MRMTSPESSEVVLYDVWAGKGDRVAFSPNSWKVRAVLNFKNIPYKTEFMRFPDITRTLQDKLPPNENGRYTVATVRMPDGSYIMDTAKIVPALDTLKPLPPLYLDDPAIGEVTELEAKARSALVPAYWHQIVDKLDDESQEWFIPYFKKKTGGAVNETVSLDQAWEKAEPAFKGLADLLKQNKQGPYFGGTEPSFSDLYLLGLFMLVKSLGKGEVFDKIVGYDEVFKTWFEACRPWTEKNN